MGQLLVDGGQSACRAAVIHNGIMVSTFTLPGLSFQQDAAGVQTIKTLLRDTRIALNERGSPRLKAAWLGLTGMPRDSRLRAQVCTAASETLEVGITAVCSDLVAAYVGAVGLRPGGVVSAGSGAVALATSGQGDLVEVGDHGALLGDQGSGYWIGRAGLRAVVRANDGWGPPTELGRAAELHYGPVTGITGRVRESKNPVDEVAQFAPLVCSAADEGDAVAAGVVRRAGALLAEMLETAARKATGGNVDGLVLSWNGRLLSNGQVLKRAFEETLAGALSEGATLSAPLGSALDGLKTMAQAPSLQPVAGAVQIEGGK